MALFKCIRCGKTVEPGDQMVCECGGLMEVVHSFPDVELGLFDDRLGTLKSPYNSGVWRYKELIHPDIPIESVVSRPEGNTNLYRRELLQDYTRIKNLSLKHEGENPTGSFKDRGMTVGVSVALASGAKTVACASTGNTSASMAAYAAQAGLQGIVLIPEGEIAFGKLSQALAFGASVLQVQGNFDDAMKIVRDGVDAIGYYILNSLNPWRIEGQKSIMFELLQQRKWNPPDWVILPAGNLGNTSAFGKAFRELKQLGLVDEVPRIASIQAEGASPFYELWKKHGIKLEPMEPHTVASAIKIGNPVSWEKATKVIHETNGVVERVSDQEILDAKAMVDRSGIGCEPASAASVAGAKKILINEVIQHDDDVVCVLTGNLLKDSDTTVNYHLDRLEGFRASYHNSPIPVQASISSIIQALNRAVKEASR